MRLWVQISIFWQDTIQRVNKLFSCSVSCPTVLQLDFPLSLLFTFPHESSLIISHITPVTFIPCSFLFLALLTLSSFYPHPFSFLYISHYFPPLIQAIFSILASVSALLYLLCFRCPFFFSTSLPPPLASLIRLPVPLLQPCSLIFITFSILIWLFCLLYIPAKLIFFQITANHGLMASTVMNPHHKKRTKPTTLLSNRRTLSFCTQTQKQTDWSSWGSVQTET